MDVLDELWKSRHPYDALFLELIEGYEIKTFDDAIFYMKQDTIILKYDGITNIIYLNNELFWKVFIDKFNIEEFRVLILLQSMIETHLNIKKPVAQWSDVLLIDDLNYYKTPKYYIKSFFKNLFKNPMPPLNITS